MFFTDFTICVKISAHLEHFRRFWGKITPYEATLIFVRFLFGWIYFCYNFWQNFSLRRSCLRKLRALNKGMKYTGLYRVNPGVTWPWRLGKRKNENNVFWASIVMFMLNAKMPLMSGGHVESRTLQLIISKSCNYGQDNVEQSSIPHFSAEFFLFWYETHSSRPKVLP